MELIPIAWKVLNKHFPNYYPNPPRVDYKQKRINRKRNKIARKSRKRT